ncbi:MAG: SseB family protein [Lachnospiraceae bacterium]|jgi:hypothetical protein
MEVLRMIQTIKEIYVPFGKMTHMPYVVCDEKTYNDQIWVFTGEDVAGNFVKRREEERIPLTVEKYENQQFLLFYSGLHALGVNEVVFVNGDKMAKVPLKMIVTPPDYSQIPEVKRPAVNPQLQLSGIYFMQEMRRPVPKEEKKNLLELEEEMAVNVTRAAYMVAVIADGKREDGKPNLQVPFIKNQQGDIFQPAFTDPNEFNKFNRKNQFTAIKTDLDGLEKMLVKDAKGIVINPQGFNLVVLREQISQLKKRFA